MTIMMGENPTRGLTHFRLGILACLVLICLVPIPLSGVSMPATTELQQRQKQATNTFPHIRQFGVSEVNGVKIGTPVSHVVGPKETLLDIARRYNLGYNEIVDLYPQYDPWLPPKGQSLTLPTERLLPDGPRIGIVINIPELRLYHYVSKDGQPDKVMTYPVGIGGDDFPTPIGSFTIDSKVLNPTWFIPPSLRSKYKMSSVPPGPDNPLGKYWLGLKGTMYGIHGSDIPWSIGRMVTHGCIRMYPEDIERLFAVVKPGIQVHFIYEPVKIASVAGRIFIEVHRDIYGIRGNPEARARQQLEERGIRHLVDPDRFKHALEDRSGAVIDITRSTTPTPTELDQNFLDLIDPGK
jgi:L,D-transpeptidase ErfK/SrfK